MYLTRVEGSRGSGADVVPNRTTSNRKGAVWIGTDGFVVSVAMSVKDRWLEPAIDGGTTGLPKVPDASACADVKPNGAGLVASSC